MLKRLLTYHWSLTLLIMCIAALGLGLASFDLFRLLHANVELVRENGFMGVADGAVQELLMLAGLGLISVVCYVIFKACEKILVDRVLK